MITFTASLKHGSAIKIDGDLGTQITLIAPLSEISEVIKLTMLTGKSFKINIFEVDENQNREDIWG